MRCCGALAHAFGKVEFVALHIDAGSAEGDAFNAEAKSLLGTEFSGEFDGASGAEDALPGQSRNAAEDLNDLAGGAGPACGASHGSIGRDFA
jgi:hypothetical protein